VGQACRHYDLNPREGNGFSHCAPGWRHAEAGREREFL
jgi:hypothetical protein